MIKPCDFCQKEMMQRAIHNGAHAIVLLSNPRVAVGHLLIIPKRHVQKFSDLQQEECEEIFQLLSDYQDKVLEKLSTGTEIRQNYRPYLKDSRTHVNHFHFHIIPRDERDELAQKVDIHRKPFYQELSEKEEVEITKLLAS